MNSDQFPNLHHHQPKWQSFFGPSMQSVNWTGHGHFENFKTWRPFEGEVKMRLNLKFLRDFISRPFIDTKSIETLFTLCMYTLILSLPRVIKFSVSHQSFTIQYGEFGNTVWPVCMVTSTRELCDKIWLVPTCYSRVLVDNELDQNNSD